MQEDKNKVETVLFTTGRFINLEELGRLSGIGSIGYLKNVLEELKKDYQNKTGSLQIIEQGNAYKLGIKKEYLYLTETLLTDAELDKPTQETLAVIAYKNPALQHEIIKIRGNKAYDHVKNFVSMGLIKKKKTGHTSELSLSEDFYDYFNLDSEGLAPKEE